MNIPSQILLIWFLIGFACAIIGLLYDCLICKIRVNKDIILPFLGLVILGVISIPIVIYFIILDIKDK